MKEWMSKKAMEVFGGGYALASAERLPGGAQKHTYLATCANGFRFVIYQWDKSTTYFDGAQDSGWFCSNSAALFGSNNAWMREHGVSTPELFYIDKSREECACEYAFVEYIDGRDMDGIIAQEPERLPAVFESLGRSIDRLHAIKSGAAGQIGRMQAPDFDVIENALADIRQNSRYLRENDAAFAKAYLQIEERAVESAGKLEKRRAYTFIHGELGPNHVMVDRDNNAYLIDIEGARYDDVEEELSFLEMRFDRGLGTLQEPVDEKRMAFYHIAHCLGNLHGAVQLKQKGYYDMEDVNGMIGFFHSQILRILKEQGSAL